MVDNPRINELLGIILAVRIRLVERLSIPAKPGEPWTLKHDQVMSILEESQMYTVELAGLIGEEEAACQYELISHIAYGLEGDVWSTMLLDIHSHKDIICRSNLLDKAKLQCYNPPHKATDCGDGVTTDV